MKKAAPVNKMGATSPAPRLTARMLPVMMPGNAWGRTIFQIVSSFVAPEASLALGATKLETIWKIVLPQALPGIMTGSILAVSRGAGEVAPILFTGAAFFMASLPGRLTDQF